jgi:hypothetical protein
MARHRDECVASEAEVARVEPDRLSLHEGALGALGAAWRRRLGTETARKYWPLLRMPCVP